MCDTSIYAIILLTLHLNLFYVTIHSGDMNIAIDRWLLIAENSSTERLCMSFLHYFHAAISNHLSDLSEKPMICPVLSSR